MAALLLYPVDGPGLCVEGVVPTQAYRRGQAPTFLGIEFILKASLRSDDRSTTRFSGFFKAVVPLADESVQRLCLPDTARSGSATYDLELWNDPVAPAAVDKLPVDSISPFSARLGETTGADAKGILDILFGPSFSGNSVAVTIFSSGPPRVIGLPNGATRRTIASFRVSENSLGRISVQSDRGWRSLLACELQPGSRRWVRGFRC
jgi:hypothetical protein